jgi:type I site-specific restriction-modification system R (restriction) subunit
VILKYIIFIFFDYTFYLFNVRITLNNKNGGIKKMGNTKKRLNIDGIIKVLESHNITVDDLKKINDLQKIRENNLEILTLLNKLPNAFKYKKINFESAIDSQKRILEILKAVVPTPAKKSKKIKNDDVVSENKEDLEKNTNI